MNGAFVIQNVTRDPSNFEAEGKCHPTEWNETLRETVVNCVSVTNELSDKRRSSTR